MEADIATYAATYVLARIAVVCAFGYFIYRVVTSRRTAAVSNVNDRDFTRQAHVVSEDRC